MGNAILVQSAGSGGSVQLINDGFTRTQNSQSATLTHIPCTDILLFGYISADKGGTPAQWLSTDASGSFAMYRSYGSGNSNTIIVTWDSDTRIITIDSAAGNSTMTWNMLVVYGTNDA